MCSIHDVDHLIPEWRQRALDRIAETGRNVAVVDTTAIVLDVDARAHVTRMARSRALAGLPTADEAHAFALSLR